MPSTAPTGRRIRGLDADERRLQRRQALLDAGLELFAAQGYVSTTIEQLCQQAYVGTKAFYETFASRDDLYVTLLAGIADDAFTRLGETVAGIPDDADERTLSDLVLGEFAHAFVDDLRRAKVTFGEGSAITPAAEQQRRTNRRTAATFVEGLWQRWEPGPGERAHFIAVGLIGGLLDIIADWVSGRSVATEADVDELIARMCAFYGALRHSHLG